MLFHGMRSWLSQRGTSRARVWLLHALAAWVLLTQQAGLQHSFQHERRDEGVATHSLCKVCLAFHASDHSVAPQLPQWVGLHASHVLAESGGQAQRPLDTTTGFSARAPPRFLS